MDLSLPLKSEFRYYRRHEIKLARIDQEGVLESYFGFELLDHKFDEYPKMETKISIKIKKKCAETTEGGGNDSSENNNAEGLRYLD